MKRFISSLLLLSVITLGGAGKSFSDDHSATMSAAPPASETSTNEPAPEVNPHGSDWSFSEAGLIPVQSGGRLKPFDSFAREAVLYLTGSRTFEGWDPVDLMFSWITFPASWNNHAFIQVGRVDVRRQLGLDEKRTRFTPKELIQNFALAQYAEESSHQGTVTAPTGAQAKKDQREEELKRVLDRVGLFRGIVSGDSWLVVPQPEGQPWLSLANMNLTAPDSGKFIRQLFVELVRAYQKDDAASFSKNALLVQDAIQSEIPGFNDSQKRVLKVESIYDRTHPFMFAWIFYLLGAILFATYLVTDKKKNGVKIAGLASLFIALAFHVTGFGMRCLIAGRPPVTNMYESVIWVSFGVVVFSLIIYWAQRQIITLAVSCTLATLGLIAGDAAPAILDPTIHPLVPVLRSNYWLTIHVLTITLGYAAFFLTLGIANVTLFKFIQGESKNKMEILTLNQLTYRAMQFGVVLIAAGTILGGIWADYSWGRFWGWDPKEVWALIVLLSYLAILHGRFAGWVNQFSYACWTVAAFLSVLMAWYGVNFILGVGLHSYGFSTGGFTGVAIFTLAHLGYIAFANYRHYGERKAKRLAMGDVKPAGA
jgi:cytochrome c-type biogenesis protein CcsB